jgi:hypothetical protein
MEQMNFVVKIDDLSDADLSFYGWEMVDKGDEFSLYWSARYNETQPVSNQSPRYLIVDDWNDANSMGRGTFIHGPRHG